LLHKRPTNSARNPHDRLDDSIDGYSIAVLQVIHQDGYSIAVLPVIRQETQNDIRQQGQGAEQVTQGGHHVSCLRYCHHVNVGFSWQSSAGCPSIILSSFFYIGGPFDRSPLLRAALLMRHQQGERIVNKYRMN
jgi:hypothetical protein